MIFSAACVQFSDAISHGIFSGRVFEIDLCPLDVQVRPSHVEISWA